MGVRNSKAVYLEVSSALEPSMIQKLPAAGNHQIVTIGPIPSVARIIRINDH